MRVLVCGPRDLTDYGFVFAELDREHQKQPISVVIEGGADGADRFARLWAQSRGIARDPCPVEPAKDGRWPMAGPRRNTRMLRTKHPDRGIAFIATPPTRGTADMVAKMKRKDIPVTEIMIGSAA